jgi:hypothetical protein
VRPWAVASSGLQGAKHTANPMCRGKLKRVIRLLESAIKWYCILAISISTVAFILIAIVFSGLIPGADKVQAVLVTAFFGAVAGVPIRDMFDRRSKILLMELLSDDFTEAERDPGAYALVEQRCQQLVDKILGG